MMSVRKMLISWLFLLQASTCLSANAFADVPLAWSRQRAMNTPTRPIEFPQQPQEQVVVLPEETRGGSMAGSFLEQHPFLSAVSITTINAVAADLMTQCVFGSQVWQPKRTLLFALFGLFYQGCAQYSIVNLGWESLFPGTGRKAVLAKIAGMNFLSDPLLFMPTFYIFKEVMTQGSMTFSVVQMAISRYLQNCFMDCRNSWLVWLPGHAVTYGVMPSHKRIPWMACLSFFYMCVLSITRGGV